ncbi:unnamed protein product [Psylliodes chrysocephalus]|uniref:Uncharacterized protein n=1 Tax=Psylliodes chrysocephalus TaxID=3402493 RepID=A0A9P0D4Y3_9CUCU|nr:unnamed protein product [Psylliodes chrysocephala]
MLKDLRGQMDNDPTLTNIRHFMQDEASPPHYALCVREFFNDYFGEWIGRRGIFEWLARSCDLTPCDFFMWVLIKDHAHGRRYTNLWGGAKFCQNLEWLFVEKQRKLKIKEQYKLIKVSNK